MLIHFRETKELILFGLVVFIFIYQVWVLHVIPVVCTAVGSTQNAQCFRSQQPCDVESVVSCNTRAVVPHVRYQRGLETQGVEQCLSAKDST